MGLWGGDITNVQCRHLPGSDNCVLLMTYGHLLTFCGQLGNWSLLLCVDLATLLLKTDKSQAALFYRHLLERNPENSLYFYGLEQALQPCE